MTKSAQSTGFLLRVWHVTKRTRDKIGTDSARSNGFLGRVWHVTKRTHDKIGTNSARSTGFPPVWHRSPIITLRGGEDVVTTPQAIATWKSVAGSRLEHKETRRSQPSPPLAWCVWGGGGRAANALFFFCVCFVVVVFFFFFFFFWGGGVAGV